LFGFVLLNFALAAGCGQNASDKDLPEVSNASHQGHDHGGWWCAEHGVPEEDCSICSSQVAAKFKAKGDWCEEHNRAESQCFECDPSRTEKFTKLYVAKFGEQPPKLAE